MLATVTSFVLTRLTLAATSWLSCNEQQGVLVAIFPFAGI